MDRGQSLFNTCLPHSIATGNEKFLDEHLTSEEFIATLDNDLETSSFHQETICRLHDFLNRKDESIIEYLRAGGGYGMIRHLHAFLCSFENDLQHYGYTCASALSQILDPHELAEHMMDELICISWNTDMSEHAFIQTSVQSVLYFELFGKALERMTDHRDWMLFLPFLANYVQRTWTCIESIIRDHSVFYCEDAPNFWNQAIILHASSVLDLIEFIHSRTVITSVSEFPIHTTDIGLENGDAKRRYLAYYLHMLLHEMVFLNVDMDLSKTYYDLYHPKYNIQRSKQGNRSSTKREHFPLLEVICRSANIASLHGMTFIRMCQLKRQLDENEKILGKDAHMFNDDSQIINSRLYPIDFHGIATLISMSMYDRYIYPAVFHCKSSHLMPTVLSSMWIGKEYTGIMLNLLLGSPELVCHIDKCIFFLLYLGDDIDTQFHFEDIEKKMKGPLGKENEFSSMKCIEILSSVASTCPNSSIRFLCFQLIKRALELGDDEVRVFCLMEFLDRCPYVSMKTAAISLLKDQIDRSYTQYDKEKIQSVFITPFVYDKFFKVIFNVKDTWMKSTSHAEFWDDYSYIMQGLNMYLFLLIRDKKHNLITLWNKDSIDSMMKGYITPLHELIDQMIQESETDDMKHMQLDMMTHLLTDIKSRLKE